MSQGFKRGSRWRTNSPTHQYLWQVRTPAQIRQQYSMQSDMLDLERYRATRNFRGNKFHKRNQGSIFLGGNYSNRVNVRAPTQFTRKRQFHHVKRRFSSRTDTFIFTSITPVLLDQSNETSSVFTALKSTNHFLPQSMVSCRSDISRCCHKSHLE